jgi:phosphoglycerate dehydrogenase-like enzyme
MGMEVYAFTRTPYTADKKAKSDHYSVPGMGDPQGQLPSRWFHGESRDAVNEFLRQDLDLLVLCLPLTTATEYLLGAEQFDILTQGKKRTFVSNVARGKLIRTEALVDALHKGKIRGAAVDVTDPEPLPESHPLFSAPNVVITPHVSWQSVNNWDRMMDILEAIWTAWIRVKSLLTSRTES